MESDWKERFIAIGFWFAVLFFVAAIVYLYNKGAETLAEDVPIHNGPQDAIKLPD